jgi:DNA invertase Pin-like site-specific DNA recombinase
MFIWTRRFGWVVKSNKSQTPWRMTMANADPQTTSASRYAVAYFRTSSATSMDGDSVPRQRQACADYAARAGYEIRREFSDMAVKGADALNARPGFQAMLAWCDASDCRTIIVENASRFARDILVQETGYRLLKAAKFDLIAADHPGAFTDDTPTATMIRQILGVVAEFEKANLVAKLRAARDRKSAELGRRIEAHVINPAQIAAAKRLAFKGSLRRIAVAMAEEGFLTSKGTVLSAAHVNRLLAQP